MIDDEFAVDDSCDGVPDLSPTRDAEPMPAAAVDEEIDPPDGRWPTLPEIAARAAEVRADWTERERANRWSCLAELPGGAAPAKPVDPGRVRRRVRACIRIAGAEIGKLRPMGLHAESFTLFVADLEKQIGVEGTLLLRLASTARALRWSAAMAREHSGVDGAEQNRDSGPGFEGCEKADSGGDRRSNRHDDGLKLSDEVHGVGDQPST